MSNRLKKQIEVEKEMLNQLLSDHMPLLKKCIDQTPDRIELSALAAMLHGFYNGIENIFKRILIETGEELPIGDRWHKSLIDAVARPSNNRPEVISDETANALQEYMEFRHFFRNAYPFQIKWDLMAHLVKECSNILIRLDKELDEFMGK